MRELKFVIVTLFALMCILIAGKSLSDPEADEVYEAVEATVETDLPMASDVILEDACVTNDASIMQMKSVDTLDSVEWRASDRDVADYSEQKTTEITTTEAEPITHKEETTTWRDETTTERTDEDVADTAEETTEETTDDDLEASTEEEAMSEETEVEAETDTGAEAESETASESKYSQSDIELIALLTMAEAEGESDYGKRLVIDTVLNRVDSSTFPNNVHDVCYQKSQYTGLTGSRVKRCSVQESYCQLVREEMESRTNYDVIYFRMNRYHSFGTPLFKEGCHYFSGF